VRGFLLILLVCAVSTPPAFSEWNRTSGLIDIPTARLMGANVLRVSTNWYSAFGKDSFPTDGDFDLSYGIANRAELSTYMLTTKDLAASIAFRLNEETERMPAFALGVQDVSTSKWITSVGDGPYMSFSDDIDYWTVSSRNPERNSAYLLGTKDLGKFGEYTLGLGRGRFVGYGYRSYYFNSDMFFGGGRKMEDRHLDALGLFMGGSLEIARNIFAMAEFDGRDANAGLAYKHPYFTVQAAMTHMEQIDKINQYDARFALGVSVNNSFMYQAPCLGVIAGKVTDRTSGVPLGATVGLREVEQPGVKSSTTDGSYALYVESGTYAVRAVSTGYKWRQARVPVLPGKTTSLDFPLGSKVSSTVANEINKRLTDGYNYYLAGNYAGAIAEWNRVLGLSPNHRKAKNYLAAVGQKVAGLAAGHRSSALTYESQARYSMAINEWNEVLKLDPQNQEAKNSIASLQARMEAQARAAEAAKKPIAEKPVAKPPAQAPPVAQKQPVAPVVKAPVESIYKEGVSLYLAGKYKQAIAKFEEVLKIDPNHAGAKSYLGKAQARLKAIEG
jgi:tetratricopeptide (TPR) repeat protein